MARALSAKLSAGIIVTIVLWQVSSCCCCLGGAVIPPMTSTPVSGELSSQVRERVNGAKSQQGPFKLEITDQELTSYVVGLLQSGAGEFPARDMQIRFSDGYVEIWATFVDIAPTDVPVYVRATVSAADGDLVFSISEANAGVFPVPGAMRETIAQTLGESLAELLSDLEVDRVEVRAGKAVVAGRVMGELPDLP